MALLLCFLSLQEILTLRPQGGCSFSGVGSSVLSELVLEASVTHSCTRWLVFEVLGGTPSVLTPLVWVHHPLANLRQMEPCGY